MDSDQNCTAEKSDCSHRQAVESLEENKKQRYKNTTIIILQIDKLNKYFE